MSSWETPEAESKFEIWEDAEWEPALRALEGYGMDSEFSGKPDPKALAKLLRSGKPVPEAVAKQLGWWLDPPWRNKGPSLTIHLPKRYYPTAKGLKERIIVKRKVEEALEKMGKVEAAVADVQRQTGYSRSYIMDAWRLTVQEVVILSSKFTPDPFLSPRQPENREDSVFADTPGHTRIRRAIPKSRIATMIVRKFDAPVPVQGRPPKHDQIEKRAYRINEFCSAYGLGPRRSSACRRNRSSISV